MAEHRHETVQLLSVLLDATLRAMAVARSCRDDPLLFALLAETRGPLVGASGALFGFFGALKRWEWRWISASGASSRRFWGTIIGLVVINLLLAVSFQGAEIAWQAHLGGFIAGWFIAPMIAPNRASSSPL